MQGFNHHCYHNDPQGHFMKPDNPETRCSLSVKMNSYTTPQPCLNTRGGESLPTIFGTLKEDNPSWLMKHGPCSRKGILMQRSIMMMMDDIGPFREMKMTCDTMTTKKFNGVLSFTLFPTESLLRSPLDNIQKPLTISIPFKTFNYLPTFPFTCLPTAHPYQTILFTSTEHSDQTILFITTHSPRTYYKLKTILPTTYRQHLINLAHTNGQDYLCRKLRQGLSNLQWQKARASPKLYQSLYLHVDKDQTNEEADSGETPELTRRQRRRALHAQEEQ